MVPSKRVRVTTEGLPAADGFECFRAALRNDSAPAEMRCADPAGFSGRIETVEFGPVTVVDTTSTAPGRRDLLRGPELICRADPREYRLLLNLGGPAVFAHNGHDTNLKPYGMTFLDTSVPVRAWSGSRRDRWLSMRMAAASLPVPAATVKRLAGARLHAHSGIGAMLARALIQISHDPGSYRLADAQRVSTILLDLAAALVAGEFETAAILTPECRRRTLMRQILAYIQQHLGDPALRPATIAAAHSISTRTLYNLFQDESLAVATWIRARRLDRCRHDLADPRQIHRPINTIASHWGFTSPEHFTRAFKAAYGVTPGTYRQHQLTSARPS